MDASVCTNCESQIEAADNFCRRCGVAVGHAELPAIRTQAPLAIWKPQLSPVVRGAAVMAVGTVGQFLLRRAISRFGAGKTPSTGTIQIRQPRQRDGLADEAQIITEMVMMRRVRIRRQPE